MDSTGAQAHPRYAEAAACRDRLVPTFGRKSINTHGDGLYCYLPVNMPDGQRRCSLSLYWDDNGETYWIFVRAVPSIGSDWGLMDDLERGLALLRSMAIPATESRQDARNGPKAAMDTDSSNGAPGAPVGASNGRT